MSIFEVKAFEIPILIGISQQTIDEHLKLYAGYVKHANLIREHIETLAKIDSEKYAYELAELQRRFGFEFCGMRNHEYYFQGFVGGAKPINESGKLYQALVTQWGDFQHWFLQFKAIAKTRGVGWAILYYDSATQQLLSGWIDEQHLGHLVSAQPILALDMWEHSFVADYMPSGKGSYIEDFFKNLNWTVIEKNFEDVPSS